MIFERLANGIMKHSKVVIIIWIAVLICSVPFMLKVSSVLDYDTEDIAGSQSESTEGMEVIEEYFFPSGLDMASVALTVIEFSNDEEKAQAENFYNVFNEHISEYVVVVDGKEVPKLSEFIQYGVEQPVEGGPGVAMYAMMYDMTVMSVSDVVNDTGDLRAFIKEVTSEEAYDLETYVTGSPAISYDMEVGSAEDISHIDVFSILLILILVGLFFRSFVTSAMPPMTIGVALGVAFCALFFIGSILDIFFITQMLIVVSMLGAGCDYCIFILARYREERRNGRDHDAAVKESIMWAGESITTSGLAVMIGFGAMSVCSFSLISTMGVMLAIGILIALLAALTLITSILNLVGDRIFWPTPIESIREGGKAMKGWFGKFARFGHRYFTKSAAFSIKHAKIIVVAALLFTVPMAYVYATSESSYDMTGSMLTGESKEGLEIIEDYSDGGMIMPDYVVVGLNEPLATITLMELQMPDLSDLTPEEIQEMQEMQAVLDELKAALPDIPIGMLTWSDPNYLGELSEISQTLLLGDNNISAAGSVIVWNALTEAMHEVYPQDVEHGETDEDYAIRIYNLVLASLPTMDRIIDQEILDLLIIYLEGIGELKYNSEVAGSVMDYFNNYITGSVGGEYTSETEINIDYVKFTVITHEQSMSDRSMDSLRFIDETFSDWDWELVETYWLTGTAAVMYDVSEQVGAEFMHVELLAILLIFLLLFFVMKSYLTPLRSILTILMSVVWTVAVTHLLFGNVLGEGIIWMIPIILIVICLGLGMDYDILLTTRIKENRMHRGMSNDEAITEAVVSSGSVITICGLIMGGAFGTLMLSSMLMLQQFGFALAFAIIVDALIVRTYIVPAVMHLMGDWCWKGPKLLQKGIGKER